MQINDLHEMAQLEYQTLDGKPKFAVRPISTLLQPVNQSTAEQSKQPAPNVWEQDFNAFRSSPDGQSIVERVEKEMRQNRKNSIFATEQQKGLSFEDQQKSRRQLREVV